MIIDYLCIFLLAGAVTCGIIFGAVVAYGLVLLACIILLKVTGGMAKPSP